MSCWPGTRSYPARLLPHQRRGSLCFDDLETRAAEPYGPFGDHLRAMLMLLQHKEGLVEGMRQLVAQGSLPDDDSHFRLHGAGLVERDNGRLRPANLLYARFFRSLA